MDGSTRETRTVRVYNPAAEETGTQDALAPRFGSLDGKVIGLLNNTKDRTDVIFDVVEAHLKDRFPTVEVRHYRKESVSGMRPDMLAAIKADCDGVVTALGD
ncbi:MAG: hypothetical protein MJE12_00740 [Alphaproteobacteria bacterium]|nr:hypothetical protein [Alphaproteobacteria bacterium]